ncbi:bone morphogenetic protein 1-like [Patiria miniata]|uniref:CUB domain-containing protein n=1 Tax=Patiria miniata TaxID=46514 RepID=A0A914BA28_PATMI|nr:bone morphogenetic protein 1-like [Patiria miniata]
MSSTELIDLAANQSITITSPSYPGNYQNNLDIEWFIQTAEDFRILLSFHAFNTESGNDYLVVGNGRDSTDSSTWVILGSGSSLPPDTLSTGNAMWLRFTSDGVITKSGFSLSARSVESLGKSTLNEVKH